VTFVSKGVFLSPERDGSEGEFNIKLSDHGMSGNPSIWEI
jgi:hypothetical protein